mgnify:CR=1 FL=1
MCVGGTPKAPTPAPRAPEAAQTPDVAAATISGDTDARRRARASGSGTAGTLLTSSRGVTDSAATATKTLLGQ